MPTMYDVVPRIIIPETCLRQCAYAELFEPLPSTVFVSHWWGEEFVKFLSCLDNYAKANAEDDKDGDWATLSLWICSFANRQHSVNLGTSLATSPFEKALSSNDCKGIVMVLDSEATPLTRIWCIYEVLRVHMLEHPFDMATENGVLTRAGVEPRGALREDLLQLSRRIFQIDPQSAQASVEQDRVTILEEVDKAVGIEQFSLAVKGLLAKAFLKAGPQLRVSDSALSLEFMRIGQQAEFEVSWGGRTELHIAAQRGDISRAQYIIDARGNINEQSGTLQVTPLHLAARYNQNETMTMKLIQENANVHALDSGERTPLFWAALGGQMPTLDALLSSRADANARDMQGYTVNMLAASQGYAEIIARLVDARADLLPHGSKVVNCLSLLTIYGGAPGVILMLKKRLDPNTVLPGSKSLLETAAMSGNVSVMQALVTHRAAVDRIEPEMSALVAAASAGHDAAVSYLLGQQADVTVRTKVTDKSLGDDAVTLAAGGGHNKVLSKLLAMRADLQAVYGEHRYSVLHNAAAWGRPKSVRLLVQARSDVNAEDCDGEGALHYAARHGYDAVVKELLAARADVNLETFDGETAADIAEEHGYPMTSSLLKSFALSHPSF